VIKGLGVVGTIALILVAGGIFVHNIEWIHHHFLPNFNSTLREALAGIIGGLIAIPIFKLGTKAISLVKK
jgi:predicted DNA repair protein MutK